jgi:hypothetical protein
MHIGGGEPFLRPEGLLAVLESAAEAGVQIEYVETNSFWFNSAERARELLLEIRNRGVYTLLLSISPFHNAFIPFGKVEGVMQACNECGMSIFPWTMEMLPDLQAMDAGRRHSLDEYAARFGEDYVVRAMNRYGVIPGGRALRTLEPYVRRHPLDEILAMQSPCERLQGTTHFHVDLYGNYVPCLCPGLSIRLEDIGDELGVDEYPIFLSLVESGISGLHELAAREYGFEADPDGYFAPCELCTAIRKHIAVDGQAATHELQPVEFYEVS